MVIKAVALSGNHRMDVTFSMTDRETSITRCTDPSCYLALGCLLRTASSFLSSGEKHDNDPEHISNPLLKYDFEFGSTVIYMSDDGSNYIGMKFMRNYVQCSTPKTKFRIDNNGMVEMGDGVKVHGTVLIKAACRDLYEEAIQVYVIDRYNGMISIPNNIHNEHFNLLMHLFQEHASDSNTIAQDMKSANPAAVAAAISSLALVSGPSIVLYSIVDGNELDVPEATSSLLDAVADATLETIKEEWGDYPEFNIEPYQNDYGRAILVFEGKPDDITKMNINSRITTDRVENDIEYAIQNNGSPDEVMRNTKFYGYDGMTSVLSIGIDSITGKVFIGNKESVLEYVAKLKEHLGLDEDDELPTMPVTDGVMYTISDGRRSQLNDDQKQQVIDQLHELGLNICFGGDPE